MIRFEEITNKNIWKWVFMIGQRDEVRTDDTT